MTLACARLGCTERAHTVLVFEPGSAAAWLMHAVEAHRTQGILLCRIHADGVTVPMGWNLVDERDPTWEPVYAPPRAPDPEPAANVSAVPTPTREAEVVDIATVAASDDYSPAVAESGGTADAATNTADAAIGTADAATNTADAATNTADAAIGTAETDESDDAAFDEVATAQWSDSAKGEPDVETPTLFAVDDADAEADPAEPDDAAAETDQTDQAEVAEPAKADTPLLNRAFRAAQRF